jgi:hypothetical protein
VVVTADITKAFDMVPYTTVLHSLWDQRLHPYVIKLIESQYQVAYTKLSDGTSIDTARGVN